MAEINKEQDRALDWEDPIEKESEEFSNIILDEGDYQFAVTGMEKGWFNGSAKVKACNKATITLVVDTPKGKATAKTMLLLLESMEWKLSSFFRCIGRKKPGEKIVPRWNELIGATGLAHFAPRTYTGKDGKTYQTNDVKRFISPKETNNSTVKSPEVEKKPETTIQGFIPITDEEIPF